MKIKNTDISIGAHFVKLYKRGDGADRTFKLFFVVCAKFDFQAVGIT